MASTEKSDMTKALTKAPQLAITRLSIVSGNDVLKIPNTTYYVLTHITLW